MASPCLFLVVLGGRTARAHIELHDVRFVVGQRIEDTFAALRQQWFGDRRGLHLDSWMAVRFVDGFRVELRPEPAQEPAQGPERLWFVNLGGYDPHQLAELHQFLLVVAPTPQAARARALRRGLPEAEGRHKDDLHAVDDCLPLDLLEGWHVHLVPDPQGRSQPLVPHWFGYRRIDRT
ncbi:DUF1543 domain-containing protein [Cyanobium sp. FGCU-52]|nr:DUF1543 domain-containing protein [Cyanobium sp. FGCU52]